MADPQPPDPSPDDMSGPPQYRWPKYLLAALILGAVLWVWFVAKEAQRIRTFRPVDSPHQINVGTNAGGSAPTNQPPR